MKPLKMLVGALALLSLSAQAKTVALWPLESDDLRCVVNPLNDLSKVASHFVTGGRGSVGTPAQSRCRPPSIRASQPFRRARVACRH